jgi:hypothetical protein
MGMARLRGQGAISALVLVRGATVTSAVTTTYVCTRDNRGDFAMGNGREW